MGYRRRWKWQSGCVHTSNRPRRRDLQHRVDHRPILVLSENVAESRTRTLQASTAVVGTLAVLNWLGAMRLGIPGLVGSSGVYWINDHEAGVFIAAIGVALMAIGGFAIAVNAWRHNGTLRDPTDVVVTRCSMIGGVLQATLGGGGFVLRRYAALAAVG